MKNILEGKTSQLVLGALIVLILGLAIAGCAKTTKETSQDPSDSKSEEVLSENKAPTGVKETSETESAMPAFDSATKPETSEKESIKAEASATPSDNISQGVKDYVNEMNQLTDELYNCIKNPNQDVDEAQRIAAKFQEFDNKYAAYKDTSKLTKEEQKYINDAYENINKKYNGDIIVDIDGGMGNGSVPSNPGTYIQLYPGSGDIIGDDGTVSFDPSMIPDLFDPSQLPDTWNSGNFDGSDAFGME